MTGKSNADEPAFATFTKTTSGVVEARGLTKREWLTGMVAQGLTRQWTIDPGPTQNYLREYRLARNAVLLADALLQELEKEKP